MSFCSGAGLSTVPSSSSSSSSSSSLYYVRPLSDVTEEFLVDVIDRFLVVFFLSFSSELSFSFVGSPRGAFCKVRELGA